MPGKQVTELEALPSFTDTSLLPVHNGAGLKKGLLSKLVEYLGTKFSNPNLLINPDFKVNQRGLTTYNETDYSFDRWKIYNTTVKQLGNGISYKGGSATTNSVGTLENYISQILETELNEEFTISVKVSSIVGSFRLEAMKKGGTSLLGGNALIGKKEITTNGIHTLTLDGSSAPLSIIRFGTTSQNGACTIEWIKLEKGKVATTFVAPNYADELIKCQRYYIKRYYYYVFYSGSASFTYIFSDTIPSMRIKPTVNFANTSNSGLTRAVVSLDTTVKDLTLLIQAVTSKVGNCNVGGTIALDAEIYDDE